MSLPTCGTMSGFALRTSGEIDRAATDAGIPRDRAARHRGTVTRILHGFHHASFPRKASRVLDVELPSIYSAPDLYRCSK
jgi:hypothetical protein